MTFIKSLDSLDTSTFGGRLYEEAILKFGSLLELSRQIKVSIDSLQDYVANKSIPKIDKLLMFQSVGMDIMYLLNGRSTKEIKKTTNNFVDSNSTAIPKFTSPVRGGTWNIIENDHSSTVFVPNWIVKGMKSPAMVDVIGMSMAPEIEYKDIVVFDMKFEVKDKDIIICTYSNDTMIKQYRNRKEKITLESYNPEFPPIEVKNEITIHGVVKKVIHNVDKKRRVV